MAELGGLDWPGYFRSLDDDNARALAVWLAAEGLQLESEQKWGRTYRRTRGVRHDGEMPEPPSPPAPTVYQLRVVLRGISPLIWRRLLVRSDSTVADLHRTFQIAFDWSDEHLHRFVIHGRLCGTDRLFDSRRVRLSDLDLRLRERFLYEYDLIDAWQHDVRLEQVLPLDSSRRCPVCIDGRRAAPPEDCGGAWAFLELRQRYSTVSVARRMLELLAPQIAESDVDGDDEDNHDDVNDDHGDQLDGRDEHDRAEELVTLLRWAQIDRFDRRPVNRQLAQLAITPVRTAA